MLATIAQPTRPIRKEKTVITHTSDGWTFTHGKQTYGPYASREQAQEALYDLEHGVAPPVVASFARKREIFRQFDQIFGLTMENDVQETKRTGDEHPFGQLRDGTPITGVYDKNEPGDRAGIVHAQVGDLWLSAQDEPNLFTVHGKGYQLCDVTIDQINTLRALLVADIPEQLLAAAIAHSRGDAEPPARPGAPDVRYQLTRFSDGSGEPWDEYHCGDASFAICGNSHQGELMLYCADSEIGPLSAEQVRDLTALLSDPRVRTAAGLTPAADRLCGGPAAGVRVAHLWSDPDYENGDCNDKGIGTLEYTGFLCGTGEAEAEVSFKLDGTWAPEVYMFGREGIPLDQVERTLANLVTVLNDPRVRDARARYAEQRPA